MGTVKVVVMGTLPRFSFVFTPSLEALRARTVALCACVLLARFCSLRLCISLACDILSSIVIFKKLIVFKKRDHLGVCQSPDVPLPIMLPSIIQKPLSVFLVFKNWSKRPIRRIAGKDRKSLSVGITSF